MIIIFLLLALLNGCNLGYFKDNEECKQCYQNCRSCSEFNKCTSCNQGHILSNGKCLCEYGSYALTALTCVQCNWTCQKCNGNIQEQNKIECSVCQKPRHIKCSSRTISDSVFIPLILFITVLVAAVSAVVYKMYLRFIDNLQLDTRYRIKKQLRSFNNRSKQVPAVIACPQYIDDQLSVKEEELRNKIQGKPTQLVINQKAAQIKQIDTQQVEGKDVKQNIQISKSDSKENRQIVQDVQVNHVEMEEFKIEQQKQKPPVYKNQNLVETTEDKKKKASIIQKYKQQQQKSSQSEINDTESRNSGNNLI